MKIYNKVVISMATGDVLEEDSFEYNGPVAYCGPVIPFIPLIAAAVSTGGGLYMADQARKNAKSDAADAEATWKRNAFPYAAEVESKRQADIAKLGSDRTASYTNAIRDLSVRGAGPSSGMFGGKMAAIEGNYLKGLSGIGINATNMANTPRFPYPNVGYRQSQPSSAGVLNPLGMALGMMAGKNNKTTEEPTSYDLSDTGYLANNDWSTGNPFGG